MTQLFNFRWFRWFNQVPKVFITIWNYCFIYHGCIRVLENTQGFRKRSFILCSSYVHHFKLKFALRLRSAFVYHSPFTYRSPNSVLLSHTVHCACKQRSFTVRLSCVHRSSGIVECSRDSTSLFNKG